MLRSILFILFILSKPSHQTPPDFVRGPGCIPTAAVFFVAPIAWFRYKVAMPELQVFAYLLGGIPAVISLLAGFAGWRLRAERARFFEGQVDLSRIKGLSWQEFERRVADVYRHQGFDVEETGGGGADGGVDLRLRRDGLTTLVQCWGQWGQTRTLDNRT